MMLTLMLGMTSTVFAQRIGIKAGGNFSKIIYRTNDINSIFHDNDHVEWKPSYHVGVIGEFPLTGLASIETGLLFTVKGYKSEVFMYNDNMEIMFVGTARENLYYLDIPVTAKVGFDIGSVTIFGLTGPYIGIGLAEENVAKISINDRTEIHKDSIGFGKDGFRRLDYGLVFGTGVEIKRIEISVSYSLGLGDISNINSSNDVKIHNRVLGLSIGTKFGKKKASEG